MKPRDRQILQIALPSIVSNITVPLLGLIDVAIVGHLGSPAYIGAIAVGGMLFNIIYWIFGFLRMGTSGMTSQAFGKRDLPEVVRLLLRSVGIGLAVAFCLILLQTPIRQGAFLLIHPTDEVREMATLYFHICIWGAPAMLGLYGLTGWFIGMQNSRIPMYIAITQNVVNIIVHAVHQSYASPVFSVRTVSTSWVYSSGAHPSAKPQPHSHSTSLPSASSGSSGLSACGMPSSL